MFRILSLFDPNTHVVLGLFEEALTHLPGGDKATLASGKGRGVDAKDHSQCRFVHLDRGEGLRIIRVSDGGANRDIFDTSQSDNVPSPGFLHGQALQPFERVELADACALASAIALAQQDGVTYAQTAIDDATNGQLPDKIVVI
jgi:hypothetical protein